MPTVPRIQSPQINPTALPGVRVAVEAPAEAFGGGQGVQRVATAVEGLGSDIAHKEAYEKHQADDIVVKNAHNKALELKNQQIYDPQNGAFTKRGRDAFGVVDAYGAQFKTDLDKIAKDELFNEEQKAQFAGIRTSMESDLNETLQKHVYTESKKFSDQVNESGVKALVNDSVLNYQTPGTVEKNLEKQKAFLEGFAQDNGISGDAKTMLITDSVSKTHRAVMERILANGDDLAAKSYFDAHKDQFNGADIADVEKSLEVGSTRGESQRQADAIVGKSKTMTEAIGMVKDIKDVKIRDATNTRVKEAFSEQAAARHQDQENLFQDAWNKVSQAKSLDAVAPDVINKLSPSQQNSLSTALTRKDTDWTKYYDMKQLAANADTRNTFLKMGYSELRPYLGDAEFKEITNLQAGIRNQDAKALKALDGYQTNAQIVNNSLNAAGIDPTPKPGSDAAVKGAKIKRMVDVQLAALQERTGKPASNKDVQGIMDDVLKEVITSRGRLWNSHKAVYDLAPGESFEVDVTDIPKDEVRKIDEALKARGKQPTDQMRMDLYKAKLMKQTNAQ